MCFLRRLGNKSRYADLYKGLIPPRTVWIERFFGAGGIYFNIPQAKYSFLNDNDSLVYSTFKLMQDKEKIEEIIDYFEMLPVGTDSWNEAKEYINYPETEELQKVIYFIYLSNFGYMGKPDTISIQTSNNKITTLQKLKKHLKNITNPQDCTSIFMNVDFRDVIKNISLTSQIKLKEVFVFDDPPYRNATNNYESGNTWTTQDLKDAIETNIESGFNFGVCEFEDEELLEIADDYNLYVNPIIERKNLSSETRKKEVFLTNYKIQATLF